MNKTNTGGPAFPLNLPEKWFEGMTLRDYFAAKAMQGFAANLGPGVTFESRAMTAYQWADAMLRARNNQGETK